MKSEIKNAMQKISSLYIVFMIIYLFVLPSEGYSNIVESKFKFYRIITSAYIISEVFLTILFIYKNTRIKYCKYITDIDEFMFAYLIFTLISFIISEYPKNIWGNGRFDGFGTIALYVLSFFFLSKYCIYKKWMLLMYSCSIVLFCCIGFIQLIGKNPFSLYPYNLNYWDAGILYSGKYWSFVGNTNLCGALLSLSIGIFATAFLIKGKVYYAIPFCISVFSIFKIEAEASIVSLILGLLLCTIIWVNSLNRLRNMLCILGFTFLSLAISFCITFLDGFIEITLNKNVVLFFIVSGLFSVMYIFIEKINLKNYEKSLRYFFLWISVAVTIFTIMFIYYYGDFHNKTIIELQNILHGNFNDIYGSNRFYIWRNVISIIKEKPLFGGGPDTLIYRGIAGFSRYSKEVDKVIYGSIDAAHNEYLNICVNQGVFALIAYMAAIFCTLKKCTRVNTDENKIIAGGGVLFYSIQAFFGISMCLTTPFLWIILSLINGNLKEE